MVAKVGEQNKLVGKFHAYQISTGNPTNVLLHHVVKMKHLLQETFYFPELDMKTSCLLYPILLGQIVSYIIFGSSKERIQFVFFWIESFLCCKRQSTRIMKSYQAN